MMKEIAILFIVCGVEAINVYKYLKMFFYMHIRYQISAINLVIVQCYCQHLIYHEMLL